MSACPTFVNTNQGILRTQKDKQVITRLVHEIQALYDKPRHTNATEKAIEKRFLQIADRLIKSGKSEFKRFKSIEAKRQLAETFVSEHPSEWLYQGPQQQRQRPSAQQAITQALRTPTPTPKRKQKVQDAVQAVQQAQQQLQQAKLQLKKAQSN